MHGCDWLHTKIFRSLICFLLSCQAQDSSMTETGLKTEEKFDIELYGENQSKKRTALDFFYYRNFHLKLCIYFENWKITFVGIWQYSGKSLLDRAYYLPFQCEDV